MLCVTSLISYSEIIGLTISSTEFYSDFVLSSAADHLLDIQLRLSGHQLNMFSCIVTVRRQYLEYVVISIVSHATAPGDDN